MYLDQWLYLVLFAIVGVAFIVWGLHSYPPLDEIDPRKKKCDCCFDEAGNHSPNCKSGIDAWRYPTR